MILLLPVSRYRVDYEVALGRPYSGFEWTVLRAVSRGECTIDALQKTTGVHPRLVVEALVTLARAGWLAVGAGEQQPFMLTAEGRVAVDANTAPSSLLMSQRYGLVVMERVSGALVRNSEIQFASKRDLHADKLWDHAIRLPSLVSDNHLSEAEVQHLLPRGQGEWLRWVGPISMLSKANHWVPISLESTSERLVGLPDVWQTRLRPLILQHIPPQARVRVAKPPRVPAEDIGPVSAARPMMQTDRTGDFRARVEPDDLLLTAAAHRTYLMQALAEAGSSVFLASAFVNVASIKRLWDPLVEAIKRGVNVDVLWGYEATQDSIALLRKLSFDTKREKGSLRFNAEASHSHAKVLIVDRPAGVEAVVGSFNWLSAFSAPEGEVKLNDVSIRVRQPGIVSDLSRGAAALWSSLRSQRLSSTADRWRRCSAELAAVAMAECAADGTAGHENTTLRIIYDRNHEHLVRAWYAAAKSCFIVTSHRLGPIIETRLIADASSSREGIFLYQAFYGLEPDDRQITTRAAGIVEKAGGELTHCAGLHAKIMIADSAACVSSYNFLAADAFGTSKNAREIGLVLIGGEPVDWLKSAIFGRTGRH